MRRYRRLWGPCVGLLLTTTTLGTGATTQESPQQQGYRLLREASRREPDRAIAALEKMTSIPGVPPHFVWEAKERIEEIRRVQKGLPAHAPKAHRMQLPERKGRTVEFHVAPNGNDTNSGSRRRPFASLARARDAVREARKKGRLRKRRAVVILGGGVHTVRETLDLAEEDSGTVGAPVVYRSADGERAVLYGGIRLNDFKSVTEKSVVARLPEAARDKVVCVDLKTMGIAELGVMKPGGMRFPSRPVTELFFNGRALTLARWPNSGFVKTGRILAGRPTARGVGNYGLATFEFKNPRLARWTHAKDIFAFGYWRYLWADSALGVEGIDPKSGRVQMAHACGYGMEPNHPFYFFNLLEEIDTPGEWYLDRKAGVVYLYPPSDAAEAVVELSLLNGPFFSMKNTSHVIIERITMELGRSGGVTIQDGHGCLVAGCTVRKLGGDAGVINGGKGHGWLSCEMNALGRGGVRINAGDRKSLKRGDHFVENCHIHDFSRVDRTYTPAAHVHGVGIRIAHNRIHDSPGHGMRVDGNDHLIEFNEVYKVAMETDDQGGLDTWGDPTFRGTIIRYNYWHDIGPGNVPCGRAGIRLDDAISGTLVYGNVFARCARGKFGGVQIHGGKDNWIDNNVFYECRYAVSFSRWGAGRWRDLLRNKFGDKLRAMNIDKPPYSRRYPQLARLYAGADVNHVWRNIIYKCGSAFHKDGGIQDMMGNVVTKDEPGFLDAGAGDFRLKSDASAIREKGFRPIPFAEIGLYGDCYRKN